MPRFIFIGGKNPGSQTITTPGAGSFEVPYFTDKLRLRAWGPGAGGAGLGGSGVVGPTTPKQDTTFGSVTAGGGQGFVGGTASGGDTNTSGNNGTRPSIDPSPGIGAAAPRTDLGGGAARNPPAGANSPGLAGNPYGGGGSSARIGPSQLSNGGGSGAFAERVWDFGDLTPGDTISYSVGAGQPGGGTTIVGGNGANGALVIEWDY